jgi:NAD(P)-dependent dehydrogenase (short-subunit alcohol dehydrogenase family)
LQLSGQAAIVTGGASGLGAETARVLARAGAKVAVVDMNLEKATAVAAEINMETATAVASGFAIQCDVSDAASAEAAMGAAREKHGPARILVNCAGIAPAKRIVGREGAMPLEDFAKVIQVNLLGTFNMMRLAAAEMSKLDPIGEERGVIISTASVAAYEGQIGQAAYSASKGGVAALTLPAARELAQFGVRVLAIAPGIFLTPMLMAMPEDVQKSLGASVPFPKRLGQPAEYAALVRHMIENPYMNGEVVRLDGAMRMPPK